MAWLVTDRILPPFLGGDAPSARLSYQTEPVGWWIEMDGSECGVAVLQAVASEGGVREVHSRVQLDHLETPDAAPLWMRPILKSLKNLSFDMRTMITFDTIDRLAAFQTQMTINQIATPIRLNGRVREGKIRLSVRVGELVRRFEHLWPSDASLGGELTPTTRLSPLWQGRTWSHEVYSPFASPKDPLELIEATVTERLRMTHGNDTLDVWCVEYQSTEKTGSTDEERLRAKLYVADDGRVLKQEAFFLGSSVAFIRMSEDASRRLAEERLELAQYATVYEDDPPEPPEASEPDAVRSDEEPRPETPASS